MAGGRRLLAAGAEVELLADEGVAVEAEEPPAGGAAQHEALAGPRCGRGGASARWGRREAQAHGAPRTLRPLGRALAVLQLLEGGRRKEVVVGTREVGGRDEAQAADVALAR